MSLKALLLLLPLFFGACRGGQALQVESGEPVTLPVYELEADRFWRLEKAHGKRFDASGLLLHKDRVLTVNDRAALLYELVLGEAETASVRATSLLGLPEVRNGSGKAYDLEGIASDDDGNIYVSEESRRIIYRAGKGLKIDWSPVEKYFRGGENASFEGVAVGGGKLWVANERSDPRIIVVDLASLDREYTTRTAFSWHAWVKAAWRAGRLSARPPESPASTCTVVRSYPFARLHASIRAC